MNIKFELLKQSLPASVLFLFCVCIAVYLPFVNKALHVDSMLNVHLARQLLVNPVNPPQTHIGVISSLWNNTKIPKDSFYNSTPHPPFVSFYVIPAVWLFGDSEIPLRIIIFPLYFCAVLYAYFLAGLFFSARRLECALLFAFCPLIAVNSHNIMPDISLGLFTVAAFYHLLKPGKITHAVLAGVFTGLACFTKTTAGTLAVAGIAYLVYTRQYKRGVLFLSAFTAVFGSWIIHNIITWGTIQAFATGHANYILGDIRYRAERMVAFAGGTVVFPALPLVVAIIKKEYNRPFWICIISTLLWGALLVIVLKYSVLQAVFCWICAAGGLYLLYLLFFKKNIQHALFIPIAVHVILQLMGGPFLTLYASRYLAPIAFFLILAMAFQIDGINSQKIKNNIWRTSILLSFGLSISLMIGDYIYANGDRWVADKISGQYGSGPVYYYGRMNFVHYMDKKGYSYTFPGMVSLPAGSVFVNPVGKDYPLPFEFFKNCSFKKIDELHYGKFPIWTIGNRAGFYGHERLPFWFYFNEPVRRYEVFKAECI